MLSLDIKKFFGQQNFLAADTNIHGITILRNTDGNDDIFVVLLDNDDSQVWNASVIAGMNRQLSGMAVYPCRGHVLFIVMSGDPGRDKYLAQIDEAQVWLVDTVEHRLLIFENQPDDFFNFRRGLELTIERTGANSSRFNVKKIVKDRQFPFVTAVFIALNVIWFIVLSCLGDTADPKFMWSMGADFGPSLFKDYQFYRIFASMFMHFGFMHLAGNMVYLAVAGNLVERAIGHLRFFLIYMLSGIAAGFISTGYYYFTNQNTVCAGASGAIYGLIGTVIYLTAINRGRIGSRQMFLRVFIIIAFLIYSNLTSIGTGTDVVAHIAGLVFGIILSLGFLGPGRKRR